MKILCAISGLEFTCEHFPGTFHSRETYHPIFQIPQKRLITYMEKWAGQELTNTDSYLLFLALLNSTELVEFRTPVYRTPQTDSIVAQNIEHLVRAIIKINTITNIDVVFPHYVISPDTRNLANIHNWISIWLDSYQEHISSYKTAHEAAKLRVVEAETQLEKLIKNPHKSPDSYAAKIADWATIAGQFPTRLILSPFTGLQIPLADYWKTLIVKASKKEKLYTIPRADLEKLLEHCEVEIPIGTIYSNALFKILRGALEKQENFLGAETLDITKVTYTILSEDTSTEAANMKALIDSAPMEEPKKENYPTKFAYTRARLRWDMANELKKSTPTDTTDGMEL